MKKFTVNEEGSLKNFTDNVYAQASFCFRTLLKEREIRVNGIKTGENILLKAGDEVQYFLTPQQEKKTAFTVLYEDENVTVVDKESGVNSEAVFAALCERGETYFIHRLDRNTAGVMAFAKTPPAETELKDAFRDRRAEKTYLAVAVGKMPKKHAVEEAYLYKDEARSQVFVSREPRGEKIVTEYEVIEEGARTSLLKITLHTGKTHQIRAHLAFLKHPVAGDEKYGDGAFNRKIHATRQLLVAKRLSFRFTGGLSYLNGRAFVSKKSLKII